MTGCLKSQNVYHNLNTTGGFFSRYPTHEFSLPDTNPKQLNFVDSTIQIFNDVITSEYLYLVCTKRLGLFVYSQTCPCGHLYSTVICIKRSYFLVLS